MFWAWLDGQSLNKIARRFDTNPAVVNRALKKSVDIIDTFCYNRDRYTDKFGHLFKEMAKNAKRVYPKRCFDDDWGLTDREVKVLKLWKVQGYNTEAIAKRTRTSVRTIRLVKTSINRKVDIDDIEREFASNTGSDFDLSYSAELSGV